MLIIRWRYCTRFPLFLLLPQRLCSSKSLPSQSRNVTFRRVSPSSVPKANEIFCRNLKTFSLSFFCACGTFAVSFFGCPKVPSLPLPLTWLPSLTMAQRLEERLLRRLSTFGTALHQAATFGHPDVIPQLLAAGADPALEDNDGYTPLQTARKIRRDQNVGALSPLPFACIVANCSVWVLYGVIGRDWVPMVASNAVGVASGAYCLGVFIRFAKPPAKTFATQLRLLVVGFAVFVALQARLAAWRGAPKRTHHSSPYPLDVDGETRDALGLLGVGACVVMFASPLSTLATVWRTRSTASLVPAVTVASAACSVLWALYGFLEGDAYVYGPNVAGVVCSAAQGLLFLLFGCPKASPAEDLV